MTAVVRTPQQEDRRFSPLHGRSQSPHGCDPCHNGSSSRKPQRGAASSAHDDQTPSWSMSTLLSSLKRSSSIAATPSSSPSVLPPSSSPSSSSSSPSSHLSSSSLKATTADDDIEFPAYDCGAAMLGRTQECPQGTTHPGDLPSESQWLTQFTNMLVAGDDNSVEREPTHQVDYLAHDWKEEDIWTSWQYIISRRATHSNSARLENAAWRSWAKLRFGLETLQPEAISWHKDMDVTWLYGPLQSHSTTSSPPAHSKSNSFLDKKSILKKRTASQTMRQHSLSTRTLLKQAGDIVKAQSLGIYDLRPGPHTSSADFVLSQSEVENLLQASADSVCCTRPGSPSSADGRHISFNNEVAQFIAVDGDHHQEEMKHDRGRYVDYFDEDFYALHDDSSSEDSLVMMKPSSSDRPILSMRTTPRSSFSSSTIAMLPSTALKFQADADNPESDPEEMEYEDDDDSEILGSGYSWWGATLKLSRSSSSETLRPTATQTPDNVDVDDSDDQDSESQESESDTPRQLGRELDAKTASFDSSWFPNRKTERRRDKDGSSRRNPYPASSGVFVPFGYEEHDDSEEDEMGYGVFGKVIDTVNTARDIAHVIWNVGWGN